MHTARSRTPQQLGRACVLLVMTVGFLAPAAGATSSGGTSERDDDDSSTAITESVVDGVITGVEVVREYAARVLAGLTDEQ